eukprot:3248195-Ditylum_brightwellii.AAC.1
MANHHHHKFSRHYDGKYQQTQWMHMPYEHQLLHSARMGTRGKGKVSAYQRSCKPSQCTHQSIRLDLTLLSCHTNDGTHRKCVHMYI